MAGELTDWQWSEWQPARKVRVTVEVDGGVWVWEGTAKRLDVSYPRDHRGPVRLTLAEADGAVVEPGDGPEAAR